MQMVSEAKVCGSGDDLGHPMPKDQLPQGECGW
jgi:hypothetical protein